ncbi:hypothetical protein [Streptomyces sp. LS1784]|uniref:hypothetical protein n=1 Tax=Streptomyces sp. LS1784 TaxID=2851533 RepID=UPI001CCFE2B8|nr:hypothetical protein [Streptomyces sp. LS1784]
MPGTTRPGGACGRVVSGTAGPAPLEGFATPGWPARAADPPSPEVTLALVGTRRGREEGWKARRPEAAAGLAPASPNETAPRAGREGVVGPTGADVTGGCEALYALAAAARDTTLLPYDLIREDERLRALLAELR